MENTRPSQALPWAFYLPIRLRKCVNSNRHLYIKCKENSKSDLAILSRNCLTIHVFVDFSKNTFLRHFIINTELRSIQSYVGPYSHV